MATDFSGTFKYDIGAIVDHIATPDVPIRLRLERSLAEPRRVRYVVAAQIMDRCPGGMQLHYHVRPVNINGEFGSNYVDVLEHELRPASAVLIEPDETKA